MTDTSPKRHDTEDLEFHHNVAKLAGRIAGKEDVDIERLRVRYGNALIDEALREVKILEKHDSLPESKDVDEMFRDFFTQSLEGKYKLLYDVQIGIGGCARVYLATDQQGNTFAIKTLKRTTPVHSTHFVAEVFALKQIHDQSPQADSVVRLIDYGRLQENPAIVLEYLKGHNLATIIDNVASHEDREEEFARFLGDIDRPHYEIVLRLSTRLASALATVHASGFVHRDIDPSNIVVVAGAPHLIDFGISGHQSTSERSGSFSPFFVGKFAYKAPEQIREGRLGTDPASDIYAFGVTLYELLTLVGRSEDSPRLRPSTHRLERELPEVPRVLVRVVAKCLQTDPRDRYSNGADLHHDLASITSGQQPKIDLPAWPTRLARSLKTHRTALLAAMVAIVVAGAAFVGWTNHREQGQIHDLTNDLETEVKRILIHNEKTEEIARSLAQNEENDPESGGVLSDESLAVYRHHQEIARQATAAVEVRLEDAMRRVGSEFPDIARRLRWCRQTLNQSRGHQKPPSGLSVVKFAIEPEDASIRILSESRPTTVLTEYERTEVTLEYGSYTVEVNRSGYVPLVQPFLAHEPTLELELEMVHVDDRPTIDGLVYIPGGETWIGKENPDHNGGPLRRVWVDSFWVKEVEVTYGEYQEFLDHLRELDKERQAKRERDPESNPESDPDLDDFHWSFFRPTWIESSPGELRIRSFDRDGSPATWDQVRNSPVAYLSRHACERFCEWLSEKTGYPVRLPTLTQWERAARGSDGRPYLDGDQYRLIGTERGNPLPVGTNEGDRSLFGVKDLCWSLREWTRTTVAQESGQHLGLIKGVYFAEDPNYALGMLRGFPVMGGALSSVTRDPGTGFRFVIEDV